MLTSSCKAKGRNLQNTIRQMLIDKYDMADPEEIKCAVMGESGVDIQIVGTTKKIIPFDIEAKNQEKLNIWDSLKQAEHNSTDTRIPLLVFKRNRSKIYACLLFEDLLDIAYAGYSKHNLKERFRKVKEYETEENLEQE
jgi:hypothetical protein